MKFEKIDVLQAENLYIDTEHDEIITVDELKKQFDELQKEEPEEYGYKTFPEHLNNCLVRNDGTLEKLTETALFKLASAINDFYDSFLPWDYVNAYESKEEGLKAFLDVLTSNPEFVYNELIDIYNEFQETKALNLAFEMVQGGFLQ